MAAHRRSVSDPQEVAVSRAFGREQTPVADLARVAGMRWTIEEGFQRAKAIGLDQYEVRHWQGWYRHLTLCLLAHAFLGVTRAAAVSRPKGGEGDLIPLTLPEVRRLLSLLLLSPAQRQHRLHGSRWRRQRQDQARRSHYQRRLATVTSHVPL